MLNQMARAAQQQAEGPAGASEGKQTLQRLDTFLAANWQAYVEFTEDMVKQVGRQLLIIAVLLNSRSVYHLVLLSWQATTLDCRGSQQLQGLLHMQVLQQETDADALETARQGLSTLVLQLLQHLTGLWQPPSLRTLALQLLSGPGSAQLMPSSESVAPPTPVLSARRDARQPQDRAAGADSDAEAAVLDLLRALQAAGVGSWQRLQSLQGTATGGAGLAALYSACSDADGVLAFPQDAVTVVQVCRAGQVITVPLQTPCQGHGLWGFLSVACFMADWHSH